MIRLIQKGTYQLSTVCDQTKFLMLDNKKRYTLINNDDIVYVPSHLVNQESNGIKKSGIYRLYSVKNEAKLSSALHLELFTYKGKCQGYLLPTGLPNQKRSPKKVFITDEIISKIIQ